MFIEVISGNIHIVCNCYTIALDRISSVLFRNAGIFKLYIRDVAQDTFETCSILYTKATQKLTIELYNALIIMEKYLAELSNKTVYIDNIEEKQQVNNRFNAALKCHPTYPDYLDKRKAKKAAKKKVAA